MQLKINGNYIDTSVRFSAAPHSLVVDLTVPAALRFQTLLLAAQMHTTAVNLPVISNFPLYFELTGGPISILFDSSDNLFGAPFLPSAGVSVPVGNIPPGLEGLSIGFQSVSLAGPLAANSIFAASMATELRIR